MISFDLVQEDIHPGDETLVSHRFDGASSKELYTKVAVGGKIVARADVQGCRLLPSPDPSESLGNRKAVGSSKKNSGPYLAM